MVIFWDNLETVEQVAHSLKALNTYTLLLQHSQNVRLSTAGICSHANTSTVSLRLIHGFTQLQSAGWWWLCDIQGLSMRTAGHRCSHCHCRSSTLPLMTLSFSTKTVIVHQKELKYTVGQNFSINLTRYLSLEECLQIHIFLESNQFISLILCFWYVHKSKIRHKSVSINLNELFSKYKIKEFKVIRKNCMIVQLEKLILSK